MKPQLIKAALTALLAGAAAYFRALLGPLCALALAMASDYVTGVLAAWRAGELSSRTGLLGICKKLAYLFCVGVAVAVDFLIRTAGESLGLGLERFYAFGLLVTVWLVLNECLSILENLTELEVPVPGFLKAVVARLKGRAEAAGDAAGDHTGSPLQWNPDPDAPVGRDVYAPTAARRVPSRNHDAHIAPPADPARTTPPSAPLTPPLTQGRLGETSDRKEAP